MDKLELSHLSVIAELIVSAPNSDRDEVIEIISDFKKTQGLSLKEFSRG